MNTLHWRVRTWDLSTRVGCKNESNDVTRAGWEEPQERKSGNNGRHCRQRTVNDLTFDTASLCFFYSGLNYFRLNHGPWGGEVAGK